MKILASTAYHPRTDGRGEVTHRTVAAMMRSFLATNQHDWVQKIPDIEFAFNSAPIAPHKLSPFEITKGYLPNTFPCFWDDVDVPAAATFAEKARQNLLIATDAIIESRHKAAMAQNKHLRDDPVTLEVGSKAYLSTRNLEMPGYLSRKFVPRYIGPFEIVKVRPETSSYTLKLPSYLSKTHPTFHVDLLRPHFENDTSRFPSRQPPPPPPDDLNDDNLTAREIDKILLHRIRNPKAKSISYQFFVNWLGFGADEQQWLSEAQVRKLAPSLLTDYLARNAKYLGTAKALKSKASSRRGG